MEEMISASAPLDGSLVMHVLRSEAERLTAETVALRLALRSAEERSGAVGQALAEERQVSASLRAEVKACREQGEAERSRLVSEHEKLAEEVEQRVRASTREAGAALAQLRDREAAVTELEREVAALKENVGLLEKEASASRMDGRRAQAEAETARRGLEHREAALLLELEEERLAMRRRVELLTNQLDGGGALGSAAAEVSRLRKERDSRAKECEDMREAVREATEALARSDARLSATQRDIDRALAQGRRDAECRDAELAAGKVERKTAADALSASEAALSTVRGERQQLLDECARLSAHVKGLESEIVAVKSRAEDALQSERRLFASEKERLLDRIRDFEAQEEALRSEIAAAAADASASQSRAASKLVETRKRHQEEMSSVQRQVKVLERQVAEAGSRERALNAAAQEAARGRDAAVGEKKAVNSMAALEKTVLRGRATEARRRCDETEERLQLLDAEAQRLRELYFSTAEKLSVTEAKEAAASKQLSEQGALLDVIRRRAEEALERAEECERSAVKARVVNGGEVEQMVARRVAAERERHLSAEKKLDRRAKALKARLRRAEKAARDAAKGAAQAQERLQLLQIQAEARMDHRQERERGAARTLWRIEGEVDAALAARPGP